MPRVYTTAPGIQGGYLRTAARFLQVSFLVLILPHRHIKYSGYLVFYRPPICSNYSKAAFSYITYIFFKLYRLKLLPFFLDVPFNFLLYYRELVLYPLL